MPPAKATILIDRTYPLAHGIAFNFIFLIFLAFSFNHKNHVVG